MNETTAEILILLGHLVLFASGLITGFAIGYGIGKAPP